MTKLSEYFKEKKIRTYTGGKDVLKRSRKGLQIRPNGRSTDFIAPGFATGCLLACTYCYVARHRNFNPLEQYSNIDSILDTITAHRVQLPQKESNQCDPTYWTYDIGESTDCLVPQNFNLLYKYLKYSIDTFDDLQIKFSFATKAAGNQSLIASLPKPKKHVHSRIRVSLAPQSIISKTEYGTSSLESRIDGIKALYKQGYEVHLNFSPIVAYKGWIADYIDLFKLINSSLSQEIKDQLKCEVIFLTHSPDLNKFNKDYFPEAEELLWKPEWQENKTTTRGDCSVVRYKAFGIKDKLINKFKEIHSDYLSFCPIRYIF